jgi:signal transduction histidine kinase/ActR/RegA family two-component response regulator
MVPFSTKTLGDDGFADSALRAAVAAMVEGVVVHDRSGAILSANEAAQRALHLSLAEMQGRHPVDPSWRLTRPDGTPLPPDEVPSEVTLRTGQPCRGVRLLVVRDAATPTSLVVNTAIIYDAQGAINGCVATFLDETADAESRRARDDARQLMESLTSDVPGVLYQFRWSSDGRIRCQYVSPQALPALGIDPIDAGTDPAWLLQRVHPDDQAGLVDTMRGMVARVVSEAPGRGDEQVLAEFRFARTPGDWRWIEARTRGVKVADGVLFHGFAHDVTDRQTLSARLRETQREELIGQLAAGLSHNFNNMLSVILPNLETVMREVPPELRVEVEDAHRAAQNAAELVRQLMQIVRHEPVVGDEVVDIGMLVHQVLRICRRTFDRRIAIEEAAPASLLPVRAGRAALEQVLLNLCLNARDAMEGEVSPRLALRVLAAPAPGFVRVEVQDNGCGMSPEVRQRLGEPFFTTKPPGRGTGLGLTSAFGIVRELGGRIEVESEVGRGTTFRVCLPLADATPTATTPPSVVASAPDVRGKILVIDDEHLIRTTASRMLTRLGYEPVLAEDGARGLAALERDPEVLAVIVDVSMPGLSGPEVLARVRASRPDLPVILSSGYLADGVDVSTASAVLTKPYDSSGLVAVLAQVLGRGTATPNH